MQSDENIEEMFFIKHSGTNIKESKHKSIKNKIKSLLRYIGPAFVISVAYIDPGNFATNISGGASYNYDLLWVILWSNLMAMFLQTMSAKIGIATGHNLPEICAKVFPKWMNWIFWIIAETGAMATDLAEFLGGCLGLYLLFKIPLIYAAILTGVFTFIICYMEKYGQKVVEIIIILLVAIISVSYSIELILSKPNFNEVALHTIIPTISNKNALIIAVGMLGATVMPHVIYLHSQLVQARVKSSSNLDKLKHISLEKLDIVIAMNIAFIVNAAMLIVSAAVFYKNGMHVNSIEQAQISLQPLLGSLSSGAFGMALLASGLSSSAVGTLAGQTIMKGFVNISIPVNLRRIITMAPALVIIAANINPMDALIYSQVVLSLILPFPIVQMLYIANKKNIMGILVNNKLTKIVGIIITLMIIVFNSILLYFSFIH